MTDAMATVSLGAGGLPAGVTEQKLQPTLLLPFVFQQNDTNRLVGPISGAAMHQRVPTLRLVEGVGHPTSSFGQRIKKHLSPPPLPAEAV